MKKHDFMGTHIICEMYNIRDDLLQNKEYLLTSLLKGVKESLANCEGILFKQFEPIGLSIVVLLSESHASIHTYPEQNCMFVDAFTCGTNCNPQSIIDTLIEELRVSHYSAKEIHRGDEHGKL